jgi:2'-5' RNA ligase
MSRGATARLFVAIDPPAAVREKLAAWAREATLQWLPPFVDGVEEPSLRVGGPLPAGARPSRARARPLRLLHPDALHLTLIFLGSRPVGEIEAVDAALGTCEGEVGELSLGAPLWLPPSRPHALAVEVRDLAGELARLHQTVSGAVARATGWEPERRRFRAHITVVRVGGGGGRRPAWREEGLPATPQLSFTPTALVLYRSWLLPAGASYEAITTRALSPAGM